MHIACSVTHIQTCCTHGRNGIRLQGLRTSFRATHAGAIPPLLPLSVPSVAEMWASS